MSLTQQCHLGVIYASMSRPTDVDDRTAGRRLEVAVSRLLNATPDTRDHQARVLWRMVYQSTGHGVRENDAARSQIRSAMSGRVMVFPPPSIDLVFDDSILDSVKEVWKRVMALKGDEEARDEDFLIFDPRPAAEDL